MSAVTFDTLKFVEKLEASGVSHAQAKATAEAFAEATAQQLATKSDLDNLELRLDAKLAELKTDLIKWIIGLLFAQTALLSGLKLLGH